MARRRGRDSVQSLKNRKTSVHAPFLVFTGNVRAVTRSHEPHSEPKTNGAKPLSLKEQDQISRQVLRQAMRTKAGLDLAQHYAGVTRRGNIVWPDNFPRRARRAVRRRIVNSQYHRRFVWQQSATGPVRRMVKTLLRRGWYGQLMEAMRGKRPKPKTALDWIKHKMIPPRFQKGALQPEYKLVPEQAAGAAAGGR